MKNILIGIVVTGLFNFLPVDSCVAKEQQGWSGEAELGYTRATGNTKTDSLLGRFVVRRDFLKWHNELKLEIINSSENNVTTKESILLEFQINRDFGDNYYTFGNLRHIDDQFGGFSTQSTLSGGLGWNAIKEEDHALNLEAGAGSRQSKEQGTGVKTTEPTFVGSAKWAYQITKTTALTNNFRVEGASDNTFVENKIAVRVKINSFLGLKVSYLLRNNSDVPADIEKKDTLTSVSLDYKF